MWIAFTGGEPTLKVDEVVALTKEAKRLCPKLSIVAFTTNALLPKATLELAKEIKALKLDCLVTISLDGDEATHDHMRGVKGNFQLAWETLNLLRSQGIKAHFGLTISKHNLDFFKESFF